MPQINVLQNGNIKTIDFTPYGGRDAFLAVSGNGNNLDVIRLRKVVPWLNKAIRMTANSVSQLPYIIEAGETEIDLDVAWGAVKNPQTLISLLAASLCGGAAYMKVETTRRAILSAQYLAPQTMTPNFDNNGVLVNFTRQYNKTRETLSLEQVVYFWLPDDTIETGAAEITPLGNALLSAGILAAMDTTIKQYGDNGFIKPMFAVADGIPNPSERTRIETVLSNFMRGLWKSAVKVVDAKSLVPLPVGAGMDELKGSYIEITTQQIKNIAAAFGIPNSTFLSDENSYATATADAKLWYSSSEFVSIYQTVADSLTDQLFSRFGWDMEYRPEQLEAFQQEETDKSGAVSTLSNSISADPEASLLAMDILGYDLTDEQRAAIEAMKKDEPEPVEEVAPVEQPEEMTLPTDEENAIAAEIMTWRKFAERPRKRAFDTKSIPPALALRIQAGLNTATTPEERQAVFDAAITAPIKAETPASDDGIKALAASINAMMEKPEPKGQDMTTVIIDTQGNAVKAQSNDSAMILEAIKALVTQGATKADIVIPAPIVNFAPVIQPSEVKQTIQVQPAAPAVNNITVKPADVIIPAVPTEATITTDKATGKKILKVTK